MVIKKCNSLKEALQSECATCKRGKGGGGVTIQKHVLQFVGRACWYVDEAIGTPSNTIKVVY